MNKMILGLSAVTFCLTAGATWYPSTSGAPGDARLASSGDRTLSKADLNGVEAPTDPVTVYPGCLANTGDAGVCVWRNVALSDVTSFAAEISSACFPDNTGYNNTWRQAVVVEKPDQNGRRIEFGYTCADVSVRVVVRFIQSGNDVIAKTAGSYYGWTSDPGQATADIALVDHIPSEKQQVAIRRITCILPQVAGVTPAGRIVLVGEKTTSEEGSGSFEAEHPECVVATGDPRYTLPPELLWTNVDLASVTNITAKMGGAALKRSGFEPDGALYDAFVGYRKDYDDGTVEYQFQVKDPGYAPVVFAILRLRQKGPDVWTVATKTGRSFLQDDVGEDMSGLTQSNFLTNDLYAADGIVLRNVNCSGTLPDVHSVVVTRPGLVSHVTRTTSDNRRTTLLPCWKNVDLADLGVTDIVAEFGGTRANSKWCMSSQYHLKPMGVSDSFMMQLQIPDNGPKGGANVVHAQFFQYGADVYYKLMSVGFTWSDVGVDASILNADSRIWASSVDGEEIVLNDLRCYLEERPHVAFTATDFQQEQIPIKLDSADLLWSPTVSMTSAVDGPITGIGKVVMDGEGALELLSDVACIGGLEVRKGSLVVSEDHTVDDLVELGQQGVMGFSYAGSSRPKLSAGRIRLARGSTIEIAANDAQETLEGEGAIMLIKGAQVKSADLDDVVLHLAGTLGGRYKAALSATEDGDVVVRFKERKGLMMIFR